MKILDAIKNNIPNSITCLNVLCGTLAILAAARSDQQLLGMQGWQLVILLIILAAVADFFDGFVARMLHASHPIGAELDSLSDQVSFGVAPAVLVAFSVPDSAPAWLCWMPAILPIATALRLAKFNIDTRQSTGFLGMPVPANAVFWIGYVAYLRSGAEWLASPWVLIPCLLLASLLMVSELPMLSLKFKTWGFRENMARYLLIIGSAILFATMVLKGMIWIIILYVVMSVLFASKK